MFADDDFNLTGILCIQIEIVYLITVENEI